MVPRSLDVSEILEICRKEMGADSQLLPISNLGLSEQEGRGRERRK